MLPSVTARYSGGGVKLWVGAKISRYGAADAESDLALLPSILSARLCPHWSRSLLHRQPRKQHRVRAVFRFDRTDAVPTAAF